MNVYVAYVQEYRPDHVIFVGVYKDINFAKADLLERCKDSIQYYEDKNGEFLSLEWKQDAFSEWYAQTNFKEMDQNEFHMVIKEMELK